LVTTSAVTCTWNFPNRALKTALPGLGANVSQGLIARASKC